MALTTRVRTPSLPRILLPPHSCLSVPALVSLLALTNNEYISSNMAVLNGAGDDALLRIWSAVAELSEQLTQHRTAAAELQAQIGVLKVRRTVLITFCYELFIFIGNGANDAIESSRPLADWLSTTKVYGPPCPSALVTHTYPRFNLDKSKGGYYMP
jgi:hypothetical protein